MASDSDSEDFSLPMPRPPVQKIIHVYDLSKHLTGLRNSSTFTLSQDFKVDLANRSPLYVLVLNNRNITYFDFIIQLKNQLILQNAILTDFSIRNILVGLYPLDSVDDPSANLMRTYAASDNIPDTNTFFVNIDMVVSKFPFARLDNYVPSQEHTKLYDNLLSNDYKSSIYLQGEDITNPNNRTLEKFIKLFYSRLDNNIATLCPFEIIIDLWSDRADDHDAVDEDNFLNLFINCDFLQRFVLYFQLDSIRDGLQPSPVHNPSYSAPAHFSDSESDPNEYVWDGSDSSSGGNRKRKSRSYKKKNNKRSIRR